MDKPALLFSFLVGVLVGAIFSTILIYATATKAMGFGLKCSNEVLNNPEVHIDTVYTICQQDTTVTYHFVKDR